MIKSTYVNIGKPIISKSFERNNAPMGWMRIDLLKNYIKTDKKFKNKFSKLELKKISGIV